MACAACWNDRVAAARDLMVVLRAARLPVAVLGLGALALLLPEQMRDLMAGIGDSWGEAIAFYVAFAAWALLLWFSGRWTLTRAFGERPQPEHRTRQDRYAEWLPRVLLLGPAAVVVGAVWRARGAFDSVTTALLLSVGVIVVAAVVTAFALFRREIADAAPQMAFLAADREREAAEPAAATSGGVWWRQVLCGVGDDLACAPFGVRGALVVLALPCLGVILFAVLLGLSDWPVGWAAQLGAPAVILIWLGLATPFFTFMAMQLQRRLGLPGLTTVFVLGALSGNCSSNHDVRRLAAAPDPPRPSFDDKAKAWLETCRPAAQGDPAPVLIIASAGGGSRAGLWTGTVLRALDQRLGGTLHRHMFAVSGVSGGSFGLAAWASASAEARTDCTTPPNADRTADRTDAVLGFLGDNYLAAPVGGYLSLDLAQRYAVPFNLIASLPDRAELLERAWERSWRDRHGTDRFAQSFVALGHGAGRPIVVLNGTSRDTGRRLLTATVELTTPTVGAAAVVPEALDALTMLGRDVRVSTAVGNSARFPFITPTGRITGPVPGTAGAARADRPQDHIVDGGYHENSGMETARLMADALRRVHRAKRPTETLPVILLQIQSDPDKTEAEIYRCRQPSTVPLSIDSSGVPQVLDDFLGPGLAIAGTYGAHTRSAIARAGTAYCAPPDRNFFHIALCDDANQQEPRVAALVQLSWMLTGRARVYVTETALRRCGNAEEIDALVEAMQRQ